jgi:hypothetical protein
LRLRRSLAHARELQRAERGQRAGGEDGTAQEAAPVESLHRPPQRPIRIPPVATSPDGHLATTIGHAKGGQFVTYVKV